jgi:porin
MNPLLHAVLQSEARDRGGQAVFAGGDANRPAHNFHSQFTNIALNFNAALALVPFSNYGGSLVFLPWEGATFTAGLFDPSGTPTNNDISEAFNDGFLVNGEGRVTIKPFGLVGHQLVGFIWSDKKRFSFDETETRIRANQWHSVEVDLQLQPTPPLDELYHGTAEHFVPTQPARTTSNTWTVYYNATSSSESQGDPRAASAPLSLRHSDGLANPVRYAYNVGVGGKGIVRDETGHIRGGWARTQFSSDFIRSCASGLSSASTRKTRSRCTTTSRSPSGSTPPSISRSSSQPSTSSSIPQTASRT